MVAEYGKITQLFNTPYSANQSQIKMTFIDFYLTY